MTDPAQAGEPPARADRRVFWRVFWGLALAEAVAIGIWDADRLRTGPVTWLLIVVLVPVLVLGHVNVFPAALAAWLWRRRARRRERRDPV